MVCFTKKRILLASVLASLIAGLAGVSCFRPAPVGKDGKPLRIPCSDKQVQFYMAELKKISQAQEFLAWKDESLEARQAAWLMSKANYALNRSVPKAPRKTLEDWQRNTLEDHYNMLLLACHQSRFGVRELREERGPRLRAYISEIDQTFQTYSVSVPAAYDPKHAWPLIVSMHGHGWYAPFQGHPAPVYPGVFCLSPQGRGATDYKDVGENDVMRAIEEVKRDFNIDPDRVYLTGGSMGGTGTFQLGTRYTDQFAGLFPIVGNADNEAWTERWGWNRKFPGRFDELRKWIQDTHTARAYAENLIPIPTFIMAGAADTVVPPAHSRNMAMILRKYNANLQYREFPGYGHGGFPKDAVADALAWTCSWQRNPTPPRVFWKADQLKYGKAYWTRMEQFAKPLTTAYISASVTKGNLNVQTRNLLAFSFQRPEKLFPKAKDMVVTVDSQNVFIEKLPEDPEEWITLRKSPIHGWLDQRTLPEPGLIKKAGLEGPINEILNQPFVLIVGTSSPNEDMNKAWMREALKFSEEWKRRNGAPCRILLDTRCREEDLQARNVILFGGPRDNYISEKLAPKMPIADMMSCLIPESEKEPAPDLDAPDLGYFMLYPMIGFAPDRMATIISANSPESAYQAWGRFGNWFNWGVFDCKKYFDFAVFDSRSASPETMRLLGWFGTDWTIENGKFFLGNPELRNTVAPMGYPPFDQVPEEAKTVPLVELMPAKYDQMRGAIGFGRGFFGEQLAQPASLGMRAPCTIEYDLTNQKNFANFRTFRATATLLNSPETDMCKTRLDGEAVRFAVYGDERLLEEHIVTWKEPTAEFEISNLFGVKKLKLVAVPSSGPSWLHSGAAWLKPELER